MTYGYFLALLVSVFPYVLKIKPKPSKEYPRSCMTLPSVCSQTPQAGTCPGAFVHAVPHAWDALSLTLCVAWHVSCPSLCKEGPCLRLYLNFLFDSMKTHRTFNYSFLVLIDFYTSMSMPWGNSVVAHYYILVKRRCSINICWMHL